MSGTLVQIVDEQDRPLHDATKQGATPAEFREEITLTPEAFVPGVRQLFPKHYADENNLS